MTGYRHHDWRFCVVGNIVKEHTDDQGNIYYGSKPFKAGTKVYIHETYFKEGQDTVYVIGLNRFKRYALEEIPLSLIENIRLQTVHNPKVINKMYDLEIECIMWRGRTAKDKKEAMAFVENWRKKHEAIALRSSYER